MNSDELERFEADVIEAIDDASEEVEYQRRRDERQVDTFEFGQMVASRLAKCGYRKPRIITTIEELNALPTGTVILDAYRMPYQNSHLSGWTGCDACNVYREGDLLELPATVLWIPNEEKK